LKTLGTTQTIKKSCNGLRANSFQTTRFNQSVPVKKVQFWDSMFQKMRTQSHLLTKVFLQSKFKASQIFATSFLMRCCPWLWCAFWR